MNKPKPTGGTFLGIPKLPARFGSIVMPFLLSVFMSCVVSLISTFKGVGVVPDFLLLWLFAWGTSWIVAFPLLLVALPVVRKATAAIVELRPDRD